MKDKETVRVQKVILERLALLAPLNEVCKDHHALLDEVLAGVRTRTVSRARAACCALLRDKGMSLTETAKAMLLDTRSVLYAVRAHQGNPRKRNREGKADGTT